MTISSVSHRRLNIALVSMHTNPYADPGSGDVGGMNVMVKHTAHALAEMGHDVAVYTRRQEPHSPDLQHYGKVRLHQLQAGPPRPATKRQQEAYIGEFESSLQQAYYDASARGRQWSLIHSQHWFSGVAALAIARDNGINHIQSFHSLAAAHDGEWGQGEQPEGPGRIPGEQILAQKSNGVICVSKAEAQTVLSLGALPERVRVCHPGVDHTVFHPATNRARTPHTILVAARLEPLKGIDLAIKILAEIPATQRPKLIISGAPTAGFEGYDTHLRDLAVHNNVADFVEFVGPLKREVLADQMRQAQVVVIPSHSETYGLVALEAAACRTPVIAQETGGLVDAVAAPHGGVLMTTREPEAWANEIVRLLQDPMLRQQMGEKAHEWAKGFTWKATAKNWLKSYAWFAT